MVHWVGNSLFYFATFTNLLSLFSKPPNHVQSKFFDECCSTPKFQVFHFLERNVPDETLSLVCHRRLLSRRTCGVVFRSRLSVLLSEAAEARGARGFGEAHQKPHSVPQFLPAGAG